MENYKKIISSFLDGTIEGIEEKGLVPEHIETQISHLFLFPKTVYKICKRENLYFNKHFRDLSDLKARIDFYKSDFIENKYFSPEVYIGIYGITIINNLAVINNEIDTGEDIIMKMKRIDLRYNLSKLLHEGSLSEEDFRSMGYQQTKSVSLYPYQPKSKENYYSVIKRRVDDVRDWMYSAPAYFNKEEVDGIIGILIDYVEKNKKYFIDFNTDNYVVSLDNHSDNIFYEDKKMFFLDIYPPKEDWMISSPWLNIYRPATDILILMGENYAKSFLDGYKKHYGSLDESYELFYFLYSAAIQGVSLYNLSANNEMKLEDSIKYRDFILSNVRNLKKK